jgi:cell wall-associated NlpC family hydrolase
MHAASGQRAALQRRSDTATADRFCRESPCQSADGTVRGLPYEGSSRTGDDPVLSFVSVLSVNLIASLAGTAVNSSRVLAANGNPAEVRVMRAGDRPVPAAVERTVLRTASRYLGTRYRFGGTKPGAFDCSGFVRYVFARHGVALPRTASEQAAVGHPIVVGVDSLMVGDLLFFRTRRGAASHVAIYAGDGRIIHASSGSRRVRYDDLMSPRGRWFIDHLSSVRRVVEEQAASPSRAREARSLAISPSSTASSR